MNYFLAIDIGASSGRHILGHLENGRIFLEEVHRFENGAAQNGRHLCWDYERLFSSIKDGLKACAATGKLPLSLGIDTWGVDFVLLDERGKLLGDSVAYRDSRTDGMFEEVSKLISPEMLYSRTGIAQHSFNTIYQLAALKKAAPEILERAEGFLMTPSYFNYLLTGEMKNEYTDVSTTGLLDVTTKSMDLELIKLLGLPEKLFAQSLSFPGESVGHLTDAIKREVGFDCEVVLPPTHDTGSAYMAVPAKDENAVYISSGTWSLLGIESDTPFTGSRALEAGFTNEGGYAGKYRFLKNIMGLWMIQSIRRELDKKYSFAQLEEMARSCAGFPSVVDVNSKSFLTPESMIEAVKAKCASSGQKIPESVGELMQCVYISLAKCYAQAVRGLEEITGRSFTSINIVGGGSKDGYLNELTAKYSGLPVYAGPTEGTALGNLMAQFIKAGEFSGLEEARAAVRMSFEIKKLLP